MSLPNLNILPISRRVSLISIWRASYWQNKLSYLENEENGVSSLQGNRALIYDYITKHPGTYVREIRKNLDIGMGDLQYQLDVLEKRGMIKTLRRGLRKFVFPSGIFGDIQTAILSSLSIETEREILLYLSERGSSGATQEEICQFEKLSHPTISWHMKRLENFGIVKHVRFGKLINYRLACDPQEIKNFVQNYHTTLWDTWSSRLANTILELSPVQKEAQTPAKATSKEESGDDSDETPISYDDKNVKMELNKTRNKGEVHY